MCVCVSVCRCVVMGRVDILLLPSRRLTRTQSKNRSKRNFKENNATKILYFFRHRFSPAQCIQHPAASIYISTPRELKRKRKK